MPRIPRNLILDNDYQVHKIWRSHNKEWNIASDDEKRTYLRYLNEALLKQKNELNAYGLMSSHGHEVYDMIDRDQFSGFMRNHHSRYGMYFNRKRDRRGPVAYDRPKTCMIEDDEYSMRAIFYIHANPVRAGITKNAASYRWSTHRLYAYGEKDEYNKNVRFPGWYMELGDSWEERQRKYRQLFDEYLREEGLIRQEFLYDNFYGSILWMDKKERTLSEWRKTRHSNSPPAIN